MFGTETQQLMEPKKIQQKNPAKQKVTINSFVGFLFRRNVPPEFLQYQDPSIKENLVAHENRKAKKFTNPCNPWPQRRLPKVRFFFWLGVFQQ